MITTRTAFEYLQVTDLRASLCVSHLAAFFIGIRAETSTAESDILRAGAFLFCLSNPQRVCNLQIIKKMYNHVIYARANDPSAGSPTETLLRLLLPLSDKVH